jgi:hypothetical protein
MTDAPPPGWSALVLDDRNAAPPHRPERWDALCRVFPGMRMRFVAVEERGVLIGGAPVVLERRGGFHWIHALPFTLSGAPLARDGAHHAVDAAVGRAIAALQLELHAVGGEWALYRPCGPPVDPGALEPATGETRILETSILDLADGIETAWGRVERDTRYELRRARERGLRLHQEPEALEEVYALHLAQARRWPGYRPLPLELSRRLLAPVAHTDPVARLFTVRDARGLLCAMLFLDHRREVFGWWSGTRGGLRAQHAMPFLLWSVAQWASEAGRVRLNLGGSAGRATLAAFKQALGARVHRYPVRWLDAAGRPWATKLLAALQQRVRRRRFRGEPT